MLTNTIDSVVKVRKGPVSRGDDERRGAAERLTNALRFAAESVSSTRCHRAHNAPRRVVDRGAELVELIADDRRVGLSGQLLHACLVQLGAAGGEVLVERDDAAATSAGYTELD